MAEQGQVFANAQMLQLFPSCVWVHDLKPEDTERINRRILPKISTLIERQEPVGQGETQQTHHDLHQLEDFADFIEFAQRATRGVLELLQVDYTGFQITGCWANVNPPQTGHRPHSHPNNFLSGVYYAQVPATADGLQFHDPRPQAHVISPKVKKLSPLTSSDAKLEIRKGCIFMFPSWLRHSVVKTRAEGDRVSVSFNVMLSHYAEEFSPPRWSKRR